MIKKLHASFLLLLLVSFAKIYAQGSAGYKVYWENFVNNVQQGDSLLSTQGGWSSGASSINRLPANADGWIEYAVPSINTYRIFGFSTINGESTSNPKYTDIYYGAYIDLFYLFNVKGSELTYTQSNFVVGDIIRVERKGNKMYIRKNGIAVDSLLNANTGELIVRGTVANVGVSIKGLRCSFSAAYSSFIKVSHTINNLTTAASSNIGGVNLTVTSGPLPFRYQWQPGGDTTAIISAKAAGMYSVTITSAEGESKKMEYGIGYKIYWENFVNNMQQGDSLLSTQGGWSSGASSINRLPANTDGWIEYSVPSISTYRIFGFSTITGSTTSNPKYTDIYYGAYINLFYLNAVKGGGLPYTQSNFVVGDIIRVERKGNKMYIRKNAVIVDSLLNANTGELVVRGTVAHVGVSIKGLRCSFPAAYSSFIKVSHTITNLATATSGNVGGVNLTVTSGPAPFRYQWQPGGDTTAIISAKAAGMYSVTITSAEGESKKMEYGIGYKTYWENFVNNVQQGDSLLSTQGGWSSGASLINRLPANTDGWIEYSVPSIDTYRIFGFSTITGSTTSNPKYTDIYYGAYIDLFYLFNVKGSELTYTQLNFVVGDIIRVERKGNKMYIRKNAVIVDSLLNANTGELVVRGTVAHVGVSIKGLRCSFPAVCPSNPPVVNLGADKTVTPGQTAHLEGAPTITGGTSPFQFTWLPNTAIITSSATAADVNPLVTTNYTLAVADAKGCGGSDQVLVIVNAPANYATLKRKLDGSYYVVDAGKLYFIYDGEYNNLSSYQLNYKIYDNKHTEVTGNLALPKKYGINEYTLDLSTFNTLASGKYYTLEVTSEKNETYLLKFKYVAAN